LIPEFINLDNNYKNSGHDKGHQMDAFDCGYDSVAMEESFYYSNVAPQSPALNRGIWKKLEEYTRKLAKEYDSILVRRGSVTIEDRFFGRILVPDYRWKIIYIKKPNIVSAYSFRNDIRLGKGLPLYKVSIDSIQSLIRINFIEN
jgi:endonuclease G, mitochondrial